MHAQKSRLLDGTIFRGFDGHFMAFAFCMRLLHLVRAAPLTDGPASPAKIMFRGTLHLTLTKHTTNRKAEPST